MGMDWRARHAVAEIERMVRDGASFAAMEERIDALPLDDRTKSALWLVAWGSQSADVRRRVALECIELIG